MDTNFSVLQSISNNDEINSVLATIIKVDGSSYRKEGAMMLFKANGKSIGMISAGCLEEDVMEQSAQMMANHHVKSKLVTYDMSSEDDFGWGRGVGCNGKITILLEKMDPTIQERLKKVVQYLQLGIAVKAIKNVSNVPNTIFTLYEVENGDCFGDLAEHIYPNGEQKEKNRMKKSGQNNIYIHYFQPRNRLFIFGAGDDARPVASIAAQTNFNVFVWDWRSANLKADSFPSATLLSPSFNWQQCQMTKNDYIIIMTHDFAKDKLLLNHFLSEEQIKYIGILGPRKRTKRLLNGLDIPKKLHSPIGLDIGAEGPWEIAISILGELIRSKRSAAIGENGEKGKFSNPLLENPSKHHPETGKTYNEQGDERRHPFKQHENLPGSIFP